MRDELRAILWDFARSVSNTTLNPHLNQAASVDKNNQLASKTIDDVIKVIHDHESSKNTAKVARV